MRVLFICTHNISRSRVAEETFRVLAWSVPSRERHEARSAGITPQAGGRAVTRADVEWADLICVMEAGHEALIRDRWPLHGSKIRLFDIPDVYQPDDPTLRDLMVREVRALLTEATSSTRPAAPRTDPSKRSAPGLRG
jgi:predicted protein tyrosine phosphatase